MISDERISGMLLQIAQEGDMIQNELMYKKSQLQILLQEMEIITKQIYVSEQQLTDVLLRLDNIDILVDCPLRQLKRDLAHKFST
jgi:hypothetical protein